MTDEEAYNQAKARWGTKAAVNHGPLSPTTPDIIVYKVGRIKDSTAGSYFAVYGAGHDWEQAFALADTYINARANSHPN